MTIGRKKRRSSGPSHWHRSRSVHTIHKMKVAIRATIGLGLPATLQTIANATEVLFGKHERLTSKGILGNVITRRLYFRYTTSKRRRTSRVRPVGSTAARRKSAAELRVENEDLKRRLEVSEARRLAQIAAERADAVRKATDEGRMRRRAALPHVPASVIDLDPAKLKRVRGRRLRG